MICASCGGEVTWRGVFLNLTHTQCAGCGAINNQQADFNEEERDDDLAELGVHMSNNKEPTMENQDNNIINNVIDIVNELKSTFTSTLNEIKDISVATEQFRQTQVEKCVADMSEHVKRVEANVQVYCNEVTAQVKATEHANQTRADNIIKSNRLLALATLYASKGMSEHDAAAILKSLEAKL